jgi:hypothetical protein
MLANFAIIYALYPSVVSRHPRVQRRIGRGKLNRPLLAHIAPWRPVSFSEKDLTQF